MEGQNVAPSNHEENPNAPRPDLHELLDRVMFNVDNAKHDLADFYGPEGSDVDETGVNWARNTLAENERIIKTLRKELSPYYNHPEAQPAWAALQQICSEYNKALFSLQPTRTSPVPATPAYPPVSNDTPNDPPAFDGKVENWFPWWSQFKVLIHEKNVEEPKKFYLLQKACNGLAKALIKDFVYTPGQYEICLDILRREYDDPDRIKAQLIARLQSLPYPRDDYLDLRLFYAKWLNLEEQYKRLTLSDYPAAILSEIIMTRLPPATVKTIIDKSSTSHPSLAQIRDGLDAHCQTMLRLSTLASARPKERDPGSRRPWHSTPTPSHSRPSNSPPKPPPVTHPNKHATHKPYTPKPPAVAVSTIFRPCLFCKSTTHRSLKCDAYRSHAARIKCMTTQNKCPLCAGPHTRKDCKTTLRCNHCNDPHIIALCPKFQLKPVETVDAHDLHVNAPAYTTALATATAALGKGNRPLELRAFFDSGSQRSFVHPDVVKQLKLKPVRKESLALTSFTNHAPSRDYDVVKVQVRLGHYRRQIQAIVSPLAEKNIRVPGLKALAEALKSDQITLADQHISSDTLDNIRVVIGADFYHHFVRGGIRYKGTQLLRSPAGHLIIGMLPRWTRTKVTHDALQNNFVSVHSTLTTQANETHAVENLWSLDCIGITPEKYSHLEEKAVKAFEESVRKINGHYQVALPFKTDTRPSTGYHRAVAQLLSLNFVKEPDLCQHYEMILKEYERLDFIEKVPTTDIIDGQHHYLPHHPVKKDSTTTPIRIVFNASARTPPTNKSLNDCLYTGPNLNSKLHDMTLKFRLKNFAVTADISKAFLRIGIHEGDRDFCRFVWFSDETRKKICTYRFKVVLFGATCSPFLLNQTVRHHLINHGNPLSKDLLESFYVDNLQRTYDQAEDLLRERSTIEDIMSEAAMPLGMWTSNVPKDVSSFSHEDDVPYLGLLWDTRADTLRVKTPPAFEKAKELKTHTKRTLVSLFASVFDPIGLLAPVTLIGKLLVQDLWKQKFNWDDTLPKEYQEKARKIISQYEGMENLAVPRKVMEAHDNVLHVFADASSKGYGVCAYAAHGEKVNLITARSRVAPPAPTNLTIPRLELLALLLACRLTTHLKDLYPGHFSRLLVWTDAMVTLQWTQNAKGQSVYVLNRVEEIQRLITTHHIQLMYVPTRDNPADLTSRGTSSATLAASSLWRHGPAWLKTPDEYPRQLNSCLQSLFLSVSVNALTTPTRPTPLRLEEFTSLTRAHAAIARLRKFATKFTDKPLFSPHTVLIRLAQTMSMPEILCYLDKKPHHMTHQEKEAVRRFRLTKDSEGIIRCQTRLTESTLTIQEKNPMFLLRNNPLWHLIVRSTHRSQHHVSASTLTVILRQQYWVPRMKQSIKGIIRNCLLCKRLTARPLPAPPEAPLPRERVQLHTPFRHIGIDYTGAVPVTHSHVSHVYLLLITCTATRAVALYITESMTATEFLTTFRQHCGRYGTPNTIFSDNAATFRQTSLFINLLHEAEPVQGFVNSHEISWKFITPRAPWTGGFYERMVGTVKRSLAKATFRRKPTLQELRALLFEVETLVNNRPLCSQGEELADTPLTPSHLVHGRLLNMCPLVITRHEDDPDYEPTQEKLRKHYQRLTDSFLSFHRTWQTEYLHALKDRHAQRLRHTSENVKPGDLVLMLDKQRPREDWPLGIIEETFTGPDDIVRTATIRTADQVFKRASQHIVPLECHFDSQVTNEDNAPFTLDPSEEEREVEPRTVTPPPDYAPPTKPGRPRKSTVTRPAVSMTRRRSTRLAAQQAKENLVEAASEEED